MKITLKSTINLGNFENISVEITDHISSNPSVSQINEVLDELDMVLEQFGNNDEPTKELVTSYRKRVLDEHRRYLPFEGNMTGD